MEFVASGIEGVLNGDISEMDFFHPRKYGRAKKGVSPLISDLVYFNAGSKSGDQPRLGSTDIKAKFETVSDLLSARNDSSVSPATVDRRYYLQQQRFIRFQKLNTLLAGFYEIDYGLEKDRLRADSLHKELKEIYSVNELI
ncbi:MAG: hypothetical protein GKR95_11970 [Gammaproteobacteria bacterium]|nr:hypothetical protein [Gammaproteobacteria bacterium]NKB60619.1 hypothetical protein [Gammaproteobacteria bacterium]NKB62794.1 hypothetical protein [Gammaproteobacteria bacterium]